MRLPTYTAQRTVPGSAPQPNFNISTAPEQALSRLGGQLTDLALVMDRRQQQLDDFKDNQEWQRFQLATTEELRAGAEQLSGSGEGFTSTWADPRAWQTRSGEFLSTISARNRERYAEQLKTYHDRVIQSAAGSERDRRYSYFRENIEQASNNALINISRDPNPENLPQHVADALTSIALSGLPAQEKSDLVKKLNEATAWAAMQRDLRSDDPEVVRRARLGLENLTAGPDNTPQMTPPEQLMPLFNDVDQTLGLAPGTAARIAWLESTWNADARPGKGADGKRLSTAGGLFQFIDGTAAQYGVENRFDPVQAAEGVKRYWADNTAAFERKFGRKPVGWELYMMHQQGAGGAFDILAGDPNRKASAILSGAAFANNVPSDYKKNNPNWREMTAAEFAGLWRAKYEGAEAAAMQYAALPYDKRQQAINSLRSREVQLRDQMAEASEIERAQTLTITSDNLDIIRSTGQPSQAAQMLTQEDLTRAMTPQQITTYEREMREAHAEFEVFHELDAAPETMFMPRRTQLVERIEAERASGNPGVPHLEDLLRRYDTRVEQIRRARRVDPARAVSALPEVRAAEQAYATDTTPNKTFEPVIEARIKAQRMLLGLPPDETNAIHSDATRPLLKAEAEAKANALTYAFQQSANPETQQRAAEITYDEIERQYGSKYAGAIMEQVLSSMRSGLPREDRDALASSVRAVLDARKSGDPVAEAAALDVATQMATEGVSQVPAPTEYWWNLLWRKYSSTAGAQALAVRDHLVSASDYYGLGYEGPSFSDIFPSDNLDGPASADAVKAQREQRREQSAGAATEQAPPPLPRRSQPPSSPRDLGREIVDAVRTGTPDTGGYDPAADMMRSLGQ